MARVKQNATVQICEVGWGVPLSPLSEGGCRHRRLTEFHKVCCNREE